jgi:NADH-quinone oxidoreductase subunit J
VDAINWHSFFFLFFALIACGFSLAVVMTNNIVHMAFYLTLALGATSGLFFLAGADFVGAMQLLIYVGGTLVLLVFGVMLTAQGPFISLKTAGGDWILAMLLSGCLLGILVPAGFSVSAWRNQPAAAEDADHHHAAKPQAEVRLAAVENAVENDEHIEYAEPKTEQPQPNTAARLGMGLLGARVDRLEDRPQELKSGMAGYLLPFEIVSVHLLVVLIGAAYLARSKKRADAGIPSPIR